MPVARPGEPGRRRGVRSATCLLGGPTVAKKKAAKKKVAKKKVARKGAKKAKKAAKKKAR